MVERTTFCLEFHVCGFLPCLEGIRETDGVSLLTEIVKLRGRWGGGSSFIKEDIQCVLQVVVCCLWTSSCVTLAKLPLKKEIHS